MDVFKILITLVELFQEMDIKVKKKFHKLSQGSRFSVSHNVTSFCFYPNKLLKCF